MNLAGVPHFSEWLGEWAMEPERAQALYQTLMGIDLHIHLQTGPEQAQAAAQEQSRQIVSAEVAIIPLHGLLMKVVPSRGEGTSTVIARRKIRAAADDPQIGGILLHIDSPGGTVNGTQVLADDVAAAARRKPVYAFIDDLGASAAYWIASQATKVFANPMAMVGSIGTYTVVYDASARATQQGIKVHVIRTGAMKGAGEPGTEISVELLAELQTRINERNEFFLRGVATGRGLSLDEVRTLADGRAWLAEEARRKQLIDGVQAFDTTYSQLVAAFTSRRNRMDTNMAAAVVATAQAIAPDTANSSPAANGNATIAPAAAAAPNTPRPATLHELKAALPGADAAFLMSQLEANATVAQATTAYMAKLASDNAALSKANSDLQQQQTIAAAAAPLKAAAKLPGVAAAVPAAPAGGKAEAAIEGDAIAQFEEAVAEQVKLGKSQHQAHAHVCRKQPELREAMVAQHNIQHPPRRR